MDDIYTGVQREFYDTDKTKIKSEVFILNGKKEGEYKSYHPNGCLKNICTYFNDKLNGTYAEYHENGKIFVICTYVYGKRNG